MSNADAQELLDGFTDDELTDALLRRLSDYDYMSYRFSCLLDHATGGRMSKTNYTKEDMYSQVDQHISRCGDDLRNDIIDECLDQQPSTAENPNEDAYQRGRFDGIMEFVKALREMKTEPLEGDHRLYT